MVIDRIIDFFNYYYNMIDKLFQSLAQMDLDQFLDWVKQKTEAAWSTYTPSSLEEYKKRGVGGRDWRQKTKWIGGFTKKDVVKAENRWRFTFPPDYRRFLTVLGTPNQLMSGSRWRDNELVQVDSPSFYDWRHDLSEAVNWPLKGLLFDVDHGLWYESWGHRPTTKEGRHEKITALVDQAPPLIPIIGHRFLLGEPMEEGNPVLSVYQSDIIVYGTNFRKFLLLELANLLQLDREFTYRKAMQDYDIAKAASIPFWGEIISGDSEK